MSDDSTDHHRDDGDVGTALLHRLREETRALDLVGDHAPPTPDVPPYHEMT
ncbi:hypothetical protein P3H15_48475 [Rhodococcus sp. T2V]|uniref:hypothetical protein n=1 Tax=Rhodococcus sp. T2V TaxID=3034164 RepID=UPI0023E21125|nr:hypothetical protein [Rhodococcus sp. T2V]MDF3312780.1 hypothetical protein [Rhodococcus sp. T2V]